MEARDAGGTWGNAKVDLIVAQPNGDGMHNITVQVTDGERKFSTTMPSVAWPVYLFLAMNSIFKHTSALVSYVLAG